MDRSSPIPLVMHGRLRGGSSSVPGDWVCSRCHIGGCWPTKSRCFRCGAPRHSAPQDVGPGLPRHKSHHPGSAPKPKPAPVNPTFREPRVIHPKRGGTPPASSAPSPVTTASQLDPTAIVTLLRSPGLTEDLLSQVRAAFPPHPAQSRKKEQRLLQLRGQIDSAKKHVERLERSVTHHRSQLQTCLENRDKKLAEVTQLENEYRLLTVFKHSPNATPVVSAHVSPVRSDCESEGENAMEMEGSHCLLRSLLLPLVHRICRSPDDRVVACLRMVAYSRPSHCCTGLFRTALKNNVLLFLSSCWPAKVNWTSSVKVASVMLP